VQRIYGLLAMGWRGSAKHWHRYETAYLLLAGLATPLVLSVHTVVSFDFAVGIVPGWHTTIFPPYFVAGAIYSGFAMVLCLAIPIRAIYKLEDFITMRHLETSAKVMLATGLIVAYGYGMEAFMGWYSGNQFDSFLLWNRLHGPYKFFYAALLSLQHRHPPGSVAEEIPRLDRMALAHLVRGARRHVAGALHYHRGQLEPRLPEFFLGHVLPTKWDWMTFWRHHRIVPDGYVAVRTHPAHDLHLRIAHAAAGVARARSGGGEAVIMTTSTSTRDASIYGLMAEFDSAQELLDAAHKTHEAGYHEIDAYSPFPIEGLAEAIGFHKNSVPLVVLLGGLFGGISAYALQYWVAVITYPSTSADAPFIPGHHSSS
jgi:hypothetical protein